MSQAVYREVHPPTAVTHAVEAYFTHPGPRGAGGPAPNLIVAKGTRLEVYSIRHGGPHTSAAGGDVHAASRLELVGAWPLWGSVEDMAVLRGRRAAGERDSLLLAFKCAQVSAVAWDDATADLRVTSLHSFEGADTNLSEGRQLLQAPLLAADPLGRCAAAVVFGRHLAALQRYQLDEDEGGAQEGVKQQATPYPTLSNGYLIPPNKKIGQVRHAVFLHGYTEPLLLLLHESEPTWPGRYRERHDTCQLSGLSLNFKRGRYPLIWSVPNLPSDCCRLMAVPRGGVLVLSQSLIMYHTQGSSCVLAINSNAFAGEVPPRLELPQAPPSQQWGPVGGDPVAAARAATAAAAYASKWATHPHPDTAAAAAKAASAAHGMELEADGAVGSWLSPQVALVGLKTGQLVLLGLRFSGNTATRIQVVLAGASPILCCATTLTPSLVFLGSSKGDSLLVRFTPPGVAPHLSLLSGNPSLASLTSWKSSSSGGGEPPSKKARLARLLSADMGGAEEGLLQRCRSGASSMSLGGWDPEDGWELYKCAMGRSSSLIGSADNVKAAADSMLDLELKVMDSLPSLGPLSDFCTTKLTLGAETGQGGVAHDVLVAAAGSDKAGAVAVLRRGLVADIITEVPLEGIHGAWTLYYKPRAEVSGAAEAAAAAAAAAAAREEGLGGGEDEERHAFLLLSSKGVETLVLDARGEELATILAEDTGFLTTAATLAVGEVLQAAAAVQVTPLVLRLVAGGHLLQEVHLHDLLHQLQHPAAGAGAPEGAAAGSVAAPGSVTITSAHVRDPYVALQLSDGCALLLQAVASTATSSSRSSLGAAGGDEAGDADQPSGPSMQLLKAAVLPLTGVLQAAAGAAADSMDDGSTAAASAEVTALCLCVDQSGWLTKVVGAPSATVQQEQPQQPAAEQPAEDPATGQQQEPLTAAAAEAPGAGPGMAAGEAAAAADMGPSAMEVDQEQQQQEQLGEQEGTAAHAGKAGSSDQQQQQQTEAVEAAPTAMQVDQQQEGQVDSAEQAAIAAVARAGGEPSVVPPGGGAAAAPGAEGDALQPAGAPVDGAVLGHAAEAPEATAAATAAPPGDPAAATGAAAAAAGSLPQLPSITGGSGPFAAAAVEASEAAEGAAEAPAAAVVYCCAAFRGGRVALYRLPGMEVVWEEADALLRHEVLGPLRAPRRAQEGSDGDEEEEDPEEAELLAAAATPFVEVLVEEWCNSSGGALGVPAAPVPHLVLVGESGELTVYKAFTSLSGVLGFKRQTALNPFLLEHQDPAPAHPKHSGAVPARRLYRFDGLITPHIPPWMLASHLGALEGIMSHRMPQLMSSGVFVAGARPLWLVATRGGLMPHPMHHEGVDKQNERSQKTSPVAGMCTFNNSNCPHGFILVAPTTDMHICQLPMEVRLDTPWLCHKMPLRAQPQVLTWVPSPNLLALVVTRLGPYQPLLPLEEGSDPAAAAAYAAADAAAKCAGVQEHCELQLITPPGSPLLPPVAPAGPPQSKPRPPVTNGGWAYPKWTYPLLPGETALTLQQVALKEAGAGGPAGDPKPYLAVGTSSNCGEDFPATGRVLLFQLGTSSSMRAEGGEEERLTARLELWRDMLAPVSALHSLGGYLLVGMGNSLELHYKQGNSLVKAAFFDLPLLTTSLCVLPSKGFILTGDMQYGASFVLYRERGTKRELVALGSTPNAAAATAVEFLPNASKLSLLMADAGGSISLHVFDKNHPDSRVGQDLLRVAAAHTGAPLTRVLRVRMILPQQLGNRQSVLGATTAGGFQLIASCWDEAMFRRLRSLQEDLLYRVRHPAGLNPRAFRCRYTKAQPGVEGGLPRTRPLPPDDNGLLQGDLLWRFTALDLRSQVRVAEALGVTRGDILSDLTALARATAFV